MQNTAEIFGHQKLHNPPTPYFLVYVYGDHKNRLAKSVCREIPESSPSPSTTKANTEGASGDQQATNTDAPGPAGVPEERADPVDPSKKQTGSDLDMVDPPPYEENSVTSPGMVDPDGKGGNHEG